MCSGWRQCIPEPKENIYQDAVARERDGKRFPIRKRGCLAKGVFGYRLPWEPFITHISDYFEPGYQGLYRCSRAPLSLVAREWRYGEPRLCSNCDLESSGQAVVGIQIEYDSSNSDHYWLRLCGAISRIAADEWGDSYIYHVHLCYKCFKAQAKSMPPDEFSKHPYEVVDKKVVTVHGVALPTSYNARYALLC